MNLTKSNCLVIVSDDKIITTDIKLFPECKVISEIIDIIAKEENLDKNNISYCITNEKPKLIDYERK